MADREPGGSGPAVADARQQLRGRAADAEGRSPRGHRLRLLLGVTVFWVGLGMVTDGVTTILLPARLLAVGQGSATVLGILTFAGLLLGMLVQPPAGALSDRSRPRWGRQGFIALAVVPLLAFLALFATTARLPWIAVAYLAVLAAANAAQAAQQPLIPDLVPARLRGAASGFKGFMDLGGAFLAFALLGPLLVSTGGLPAATLAVAAAVVATFVLAVLLVREPRAPAATCAQAGLVSSFRVDLRRHRPLALAVAARFLFLLATYAVGRFFLFFVADRLGLAPGEAAARAGGILAGLTLGTILASPVAGWAVDRLGGVRLMTVGAFASAVGALLLVAAGSAWTILVFAAPMSIGTAAFGAGNWAVTAEAVPAAEAGRFFGLANFGTAGAAAAAGLFGPLVDAGNALRPGVGYGSLFVAAAALFWVSAGVAGRLRSVAANAPAEGE